MTAMYLNIHRCFFPQKTTLAQYFEIGFLSTTITINIKQYSMKKTAFIAGALLLFAVVNGNAQEQPWQPSKNPTVEAITSQYKLVEMPKPLTIEQIFPVLGQYQLTNTTSKTEVGTVKVIIDEQNKGTVWIEGLPEGRIYAQLRRSPSTYKIPMQKTAEGKNVAEGTLIFDKDTRMLNIVIGKPYNMENPAIVFATEEEIKADAENQEVKVKTAKTKVKVKAPVVKSVMYSGPKDEQPTVVVSEQ